MPKPYPKEFRQNVIEVARAREAGTTLKEIATDFGISESCLTNWLAIADRDLTIREAPEGNLQFLVDRVDEEFVAGSLALK